MHINGAAPVLEGAVAHSRCVKSAAVTGGRGGRRGREQRQSGGERQQRPCCPADLKFVATVATGGRVKFLSAV